MLRVFLDGSEKPNALTLGGIAADHNVLQAFEAQWRSVLTDRGNAPYSHMRELMSLRGTFQNWKPDQRDWLIQGLSSTLVEFSRGGRFQSFVCTVDLNAHRRWKLLRKIPSPERLCSRQLFKKVMNWYSQFPDHVLDVMELSFDQGEAFMSHIRNDWNNKKERQASPLWGLIRAINAVDMRSVPAVQAADMLAWARNRLSPETAIDSLALAPAFEVKDHFGIVAQGIFVGTDCFHCEIDEHTLATRKFPT